jgi:penicillin-binding protein 1A
MVKKNKTATSFSKPIRGFWITFVSLILSGITIFLLASVGLFGEMPDHTALENPRTNVASEIISSDGQTLGKFYFEDNRTPITFNKLPKNLYRHLLQLKMFGIMTMPELISEEHYAHLFFLEKKEELVQFLNN